MNDLLVCQASTFTWCVIFRVIEHTHSLSTYLKPDLKSQAIVLKQNQCHKSLLRRKI